MKILITGATGFIGKNLVKRLISESHDVFALVRESTKTEEMKSLGAKIIPQNDTLAQILKDEKIDGVVHLATLYKADHAPQDIEPLIDSNITLGTKILEASARSGVRWFINTSSFGQHYKEKAYLPFNLYSATKQAFEDIGAYFADAFPINFITLELADTFGPGDTRPKIFNLWKKAAASKEKLSMSPGRQTLDLNYVDNVVDAFSHAITLASKDAKLTLKGKKFAVSSGSRKTLRELAQMFEKVTHIKLDIQWGTRPYRTRELMKAWSKGKRLPGWKPKVSLEEGIKKSI